MRIAVLSDVHGNIFALQAVMRVIDKSKIDRIFYLGDFTGYYYHPKEVYELLQEYNAFMILGNHEEILFKCADFLLDPSELKKKYGSGHKLALEQFSSSEIDNFKKMPEEHTELVDNLLLTFHHGAPFSKYFYLYPDTEKQILQKCDSNAIYTFVGHSHYSFVSKLEHSILVNVGSVGQSRQKGGYASWCILNLDNNVLEMQSTPYDIKPLLGMIEKYDPEVNYLSSILKRGE